MILKILLVVVLVFCSWLFFWPVYEWTVGIRPLFEFMNQNQMILFGLGAIGFFGSIITGVKVMLG